MAWELPLLPQDQKGVTIATAVNNRYYIQSLLLLLSSNVIRPSPFREQRALRMRPTAGTLSIVYSITPGTTLAVYIIKNSIQSHTQQHSRKLDDANIVSLPVAGC